MNDLDYVRDIGNRTPPPPPDSRPSLARDDAAELYDRGEEQFVAADYAGAFRSFRSAAAAAPEFCRACAMAVDALLAGGEMRQADFLAQELLAAHAGSADMGAACAHLYLHQAVAAGRRRGARRRMKDLKDRARQFCQIAIQAAPGSRYVALRYAEALLARREDGFLAGAREALERLHRPGEWRYETQAGMVLLEWGWPGEAQAWFRRAAESAPPKPCLSYWLGRAAQDLGNSTEARAFFAAALNLNSAYRPAKAALHACRWHVRLWRRLAAACRGLAPASVAGP